MKIGILTHPLTSNYGGILQCYALNTYLQKLGHDTIVIDRRVNRDFAVWRLIRSILRALHFPRYYNPNHIDKGAKIRPFVDTHIKRTEVIDTPRNMSKICSDYKLDAVIVGSDQVWRADYAMKFGFNYFLDFIPKGVIKASYAASLGLSDWHYTPEQTKRIGALLKTFKGVSVREDEAVELLKANTGIEPEHLLDPTLLLTSEDYDKIVAPRQVKDKYVFVYWLGDKSNIQDTIKDYRQKGYEVIDINLRDNRVQHSIEEWLSFIKYADIVITDSFHGCVFSIIYQRQFLIHSNDSGGNGRLSSLFKMIGLENKLKKPQVKVDYTLIPDKIKMLQEKSHDYFVKFLK